LALINVFGLKGQVKVLLFRILLTVEYVNMPIAAPAKLMVVNVASRNAKISPLFQRMAD
jgi:hypothetical protein